MTKLMATEKAGRTNGLRKGVMRCDCPGSWDWKEQNGKRPPGRRESASDCSGKNGVKDHWNGQGNLAAARRFDCFQRDGGARAVGCIPPKGCRPRRRDGASHRRGASSTRGGDVQAQGSCRTDVSGACDCWQPQFCQLPLVLYKPESSDPS